MGLFGEVFDDGGLAMTRAFIVVVTDKTDCAGEIREVR